MGLVWKGFPRQSLNLHVPRSGRRGAIIKLAWLQGETRRMRLKMQRSSQQMGKRGGRWRESSASERLMPGAAASRAPGGPRRTRRRTFGGRRTDRRRPPQPSLPYFAANEISGGAVPPPCRFFRVRAALASRGPYNRRSERRQSRRSSVPSASGGRAAASSPAAFIFESVCQIRPAVPSSAVVPTPAAAANFFGLVCFFDACACEVFNFDRVESTHVERISASSLFPSRELGSVHLFVPSLAALK